MSSSSARTGIVTSSTSSMSPPRSACTKHLLNGWFSIHLRALLGVHDLGEEVRVAPLRVHVRHGEEAVEVVEAHVLGLGLDVLPHVPLADGLGHVAGVGEQLRDRDLTLQPTALAVHRRTHQPVAHRQAAGHERRAAGRAARLRVAAREELALACEPVDVRRRRADRDPAAVAAEVAPADVVEDDRARRSVASRARRAWRRPRPPRPGTRSAVRGAPRRVRSASRSDRGPCGARMRRCR